MEKPLKDAFRFETMRQVSMMRILAREKPTGTEIAEGKLGALLGAEPNGAYVRPQIASYDEPSLPWPQTPDATPGAKARAEYLARTFHRAHAGDWCALTTTQSLEALRAHAQNASLDVEAKAAACESCAEFTVRHLVDDTGNVPLCSVLSGGAAVTVQQSGAGTPEQLSRAWCGCS